MYPGFSDIIADVHAMPVHLNTWSDINWFQGQNPGFLFRSRIEPVAIGYHAKGNVWLEDLANSLEDQSINIFLYRFFFIFISVLSRVCLFEIYTYPKYKRIINITERSIDHLQFQSINILQQRFEYAIS